METFEEEEKNRKKEEQKSINTSASSGLESISVDQLSKEIMEKVVQFFNPSRKSHQYRPLLCNNDTALTPAHRGSSSSKRFRDAPPTHYTYRIGSFSLISNFPCHNSPVFEQGGFNWNLCFYPNGKKQEGGEGYVSLYLMIADTDSLNPGWEVKASFKLFLFDKLNGKYWMLGDSHERTFHAMNKKQGFARFIPIKKFKKLYNGYLIDDACVIGAEVFVIKSTGKGDCFSRIRGNNAYKHTWMMKRFSKMETKDYYSKVFTIGKYEWRIKLNAGKIAESKHKEYNISLDLELVDSGTLFHGQQIYVDFTLCMKDQDQNISFTYRAQSWFGGSRKTSGCQKFISLDQHNDPEQGYTVEDIYIIESKVIVLGLANTLP